MITKDLIELITTILSCTIVTAFIMLYATCVIASSMHENELLHSHPFVKIKNKYARYIVFSVVTFFPAINIYIIYLLSKNMAPERTVFNQLKECETPEEAARIIETLFDNDEAGDAYVCHTCKFKQECDMDPALDEPIRIGLTEDGSGLILQSPEFECKNARLYHQYSDAMQILMAPEISFIEAPIWGVYIYKEQDKKVLEEKVILSSKGKTFKTFEDARKEIDRRIKLFHLREFDDVKESRNSIEACNLLNEKGITIYKLQVVIANDMLTKKEIKEYESNKNKNAGKALCKKYIGCIKEFFGRLTK